MKKDNYLKKLFFRFLLDSTSEEENASLLSELSNSDEKLNKAQKSFYSFLHVLGSSADKTWLDTNFKKVEQRITKKTVFLRWMRVAAVFVGLITVGFIAHLSGLLVQETNWQIISLNRGEQKNILLSDGTKVHLAPKTTLRYPAKFTGELREVHIEGEAFFEVAKDPKHPFIVHSPRTKIKVTGTSFNIRAYQDDQIEQTMLVEGSVSLAFTDKTDKTLSQCNLLPMQKAVFNKNNNSYELMPFVASDKPTWIKGGLIIRDEPFGDIAKRLERFYDVNIIFKDSDLINDRLNGDFKNESVFEILEAIQILAPFEYDYNKSTNTITIYASSNLN